MAVTLVGDARRDGWYYGTTRPKLQPQAFQPRVSGAGVPAADIVVRWPTAVHRHTAHTVREVDGNLVKRWDWTGRDGQN